MDKETTPNLENKIIDAIARVLILIAKAIAPKCKNDNDINENRFQGDSDKN